MQKLGAVGLALVIVTVWSVTAGAQTDQRGVSHDLTQPGRVTVVDFAAAWCVPCWESLPQLEVLAARHSDIGFLVVSVDDREDGRDQLVNKLAPTVPVIWDTDHVIAERFAPQAMPATFVLDARGAIIYQHLGYDQDTWAALVDFLDGF